MRSLQQVMPFDSTLQIAYVANHGTRIDVAQNINVPSVYGQGAAYDPFQPRGRWGEPQRLARRLR